MGSDPVDEKAKSSLRGGHKPESGLDPAVPAVRTKLIKGLTMLAVVILTGVSVALAGKIAFVGLIIPHIARFLAGRGCEIRSTAAITGQSLNG